MFFVSLVCFVCGMGRDFLWKDWGKIQFCSQKVRLLWSGELFGPWRLSLWKENGYFFVEKVGEIFHRDLWILEENLLWAGKLIGGSGTYPQVFRKDLSLKKGIFSWGGRILEYSTKYLFWILGKLDFFHTVFHKLWKSHVDIHNGGMEKWFFLWKMIDISTGALILWEVT